MLGRIDVAASNRIGGPTESGDEGGDQDLPIDFSESLGIHFPLVNGLTNRFVDSIALYRVRVRILFDQEVAACQRQRWTEEIL